ncbi:NADPH-dependent FMN reductase [Streptomyces sp. NPDC059063]|uniref:NADPH-dependent FMN reductase n=1 Tax=unclassified Streptomyces TaxID=2593676 RepID=UPI00369B807E
MRDLTFLGISGSLRGSSHNTQLLRAAQKFAPSGVEVEIYDGLREIPPYDLDQDSEDSWPTPVAELRRRITEADGLLIATPEFNHSFPGVLKNALDWASTNWSGKAGKPLEYKPVAVVGASPSQFGSARGQLALRQVLYGVHSDLVLTPEVTVFRSHERFDEAGNLTDEFTIGLLKELLDGLAAKARSTR